MKKSLFYFFLFAFAATTWTACGDDDLEKDNEEELITTVNVSLTSSAEVVNLTFRDLDGDGGDAPTISGGTLKANTTYAYVATFLDETDTPAESITDEVQEENKEHFVSIAGEGGLDVDVTISDTDDDGNPLGLTGTVATKDAGSGVLRLVLLHEPTKTSMGASGGSTDADVSYPVTVE